MFFTKKEKDLPDLNTNNFFLCWNNHLKITGDPMRLTTSHRRTILMALLGELMRHTELIVMEVPAPPIAKADHAQALLKLGLIAQYQQVSLDIRCHQALEMGFQELSLPGAAKLLTGVDPAIADPSLMEPLEWANPQDRAAEGKVHYLTTTKMWNWLWLFAAKNVVYHRTLDALQRTIPYGVALKIEECKQLGIFSCFGAVAPDDAWRSPQAVDPIVIATICAFDHRQMSVQESSKHFFIAQW